jgi:hypothetical protein
MSPLSRLPRPPNSFLVLLHSISFLLAILGYATLLGFWWRVLGDEHASIPPPLWASLLMIAAFAMCLLTFGVNIFKTIWRAPQVGSNPR